MTDLEACVETLQSGKVLLHPTDTIWGLACDALNEEAAQRIFEIKQRDTSRKMIILLAETEQISRYVIEVPPIAIELMADYEKPLSMIYRASDSLPAYLSQEGSVAIRVVKSAHDEGSKFCHALLSLFEGPILSSSANISGTPTAPLFQEINTQIIDSVDFVSQAGRDSDGIEASALIQLKDSGEYSVIRK